MHCTWLRKSRTLQPTGSRRQGFAFLRIWNVGTFSEGPALNPKPGKDLQLRHDAQFYEVLISSDALKMTFPSPPFERPGGTWDLDGFRGLRLKVWGTVFNCL